jgi:hypothetical protein
LIHTPDSCCGSHVDFYRGVLGHFISPQHFDGPIDCADDGVAIVCIRRGAVGAVKMCECDFWDDHCAGVCVVVYARNWQFGRLEDLQSFGGEDRAMQSSDQVAAEAPMPRCIILDPGPPTVYQPLRFERVDRYLLSPLYTHISIFLALSSVDIRLCRSNYTTMAGSSRNASPVKRLMTELQTYQSDPNEALLELGPADDDVMYWRAVMKGVVGTAYEGMCVSSVLNNINAMRAVKRAFTCYEHRRLTQHRWSLAPRYSHP